MKSAQTTREALVAEMLGDLDGLLSRVEQLLAALNYSEKKTVSTIKAVSISFSCMPPIDGLTWALE